MDRSLLRPPTGLKDFEDEEEEEGGSSWAILPRASSLPPAPNDQSDWDTDGTPNE